MRMFYQMVRGLVRVKEVWGNHESIKSSNFSVDGSSNVKVNYPITKTLVNNFGRVKAALGNYPK